MAEPRYRLVPDGEARTAAEWRKDARIAMERELARSLLIPEGQITVDEVEPDANGMHFTVYLYAPAVDE